VGAMVLVAVTISLPVLDSQPGDRRYFSRNYHGKEIKSIETGILSQKQSSNHNDRVTIMISLGCPIIYPDYHKYDAFSGLGCQQHSLDLGIPLW
jgi:hypothetical protein